VDLVLNGSILLTEGSKVECSRWVEEEGIRIQT
jgi:hypothetical protein